MREIRFTSDGWDAYTWWQGQDRKTLKRTTPGSMPSVVILSTALASPSHWWAICRGSGHGALMTLTGWFMRLMKSPSWLWPVAFTTAIERPNVCTPSTRKREFLDESGDCVDRAVGAECTACASGQDGWPAISCKDDAAPFTCCNSSSGTRTRPWKRRCTTSR